MADETIPGQTVLNLLNDEWDEGNVAKPQLIEINGEDDSKVRVDVSSQDAILIRTDMRGHNEKWRGNWSWKDVQDSVYLELLTRISRQRLYNIMAEIRRIIETNMHELDNYQVIRFLNFIEKNDKELNFWRGTVNLSLESNAVATERTCI